MNLKSDTRTFQQIIILAIIALLILPSQKLKAEDYKNLKYHFNCKIPWEWEEIPSDIIREYNELLYAQYEKVEEVVEYCGGLALHKNEYFDDYPYILFSYEEFPPEADINELNFTEISEILVETFESENVQKRIDNFNLTDMIADYKTGEIIVDESKSAIIGSMDTEIANRGFLRSIFVLKVGKKGLLSAYFYSEKTEFEKFLPSFKIVLNSLKFEDDYSFANKDLNNYITKQNNPEEKSEVNYRAITIISIILIIGFFTLVIRKNASNKVYNENKYEEDYSNEYEQDDEFEPEENYEKAYEYQTTWEEKTNGYGSGSTKRNNANSTFDYDELDDTGLTDSEKATLYGKLLGLKGTVTKKEIREIYKKMIEKYHPDKVEHLGKEFQEYAEKKTKDINRAYQYFKKKYNL